MYSNEKNIPSIKELGHVVFYVSDLNKSVDFYERILGWKRIDTPSNMPVAAFSSGRTHHELLLIEVGDMAESKSKNLQIGLYHIGLKVGDSDAELKAVIAKLAEEGVYPTGSGDHHVTHSIYLADPDGNEIELYVDVTEADWKNNPELIMRPVKPLILD